MRRRLELLLLRADAVRRLGAKWVAFRCWYWFITRSGVLERRTPRSNWAAVPAEPPGRPPGVVDSVALREFLTSTYGDDAFERLLLRADRLRRREFDVFGELVRPDDWHHEARRDVRFDRGSHWTRVRGDGATDIKFIWEPSRFGWAFDLARLHLLEPASGAGDLFWELLEDWMVQNPPNTGVNWECGQEASIRLIAVVAATSAMPDTWTDERAQRFSRLVAATGDRVLANIGYARSQRNNHHASEAVGLITAGLVLDRHHRSDAWLRAGERHLREVCDRLIFPDGGSSQYSINYHRVFLHDLVWAAQMRRASGEDPPTWLIDAGRRATDFLDAVTDPTSGGVPVLGHDDGGCVLPLADAPHRIMSGDVELAGACFRVATRWGAEGSESLAWFGLRPADRLEPAVHPVVRSFPDIGVHVLENGPVRAVVRAVAHEYRPSHDDQLHCDVWVGGANVVPDPGTVSYAPLPGEAGMLDGSEYHNGPRRVGGRGMRRATRFLWAQWSTARADLLTIRDGYVNGEFSLGHGSDAVHRSVRVGDSVEVVDRAAGEGIESTWLLDGAAIETSGSAEQGELNFSLGYGRPATCSSVRITGAGTVRSRVMPT